MTKLELYLQEAKARAEYVEKNDEADLRDLVLCLEDSYRLIAICEKLLGMIDATECECHRGYGCNKCALENIEEMLK